MTREQILHALTEEILSAALSYARESRYPVSDSDRMDDRLAYFKIMKDSLRHVRQELEELFAAEAP